MTTPSLRIESRQHQTLTPRLQQAVRLLQLSSLDFAQELQQALDHNPFLEEDPDAPAPATPVTDDSHPETEMAQSWEHESWASADPTPHETMERQDQQRRLMQAVRRLPLNARELVILTLEGFTPREIASTLELTPNVISIRLTRAKQLLREYLGSPDESR